MKEALRGTTNANPSHLRERMKWHHMHAGASQLLKNQISGHLRMAAHTFQVRVGKPGALNLLRDI